MNFNIAKLVYCTFSCLVTANMMSLICIIIIMAICKSPILHLVCPKTLGTRIVFNSLESTVIPKRNKIKSFTQNFRGQARCTMGDLNLLPATSSKLQKFEKSKKREY